MLARFSRDGRYLAVGNGIGRPTLWRASDWSLAQLDAPAEVLARVEHHYYDAGHMMYTREADLTQLKRDLSTWLAGRAAS